MMPVYTAGDLEGMTGVTEQRLKEDITVFTTILEDPAQGEKIWKEYRAWNGGENFQAEMQLSNGQWMHMTAQKSPQEGMN